MSIKNYNWTRQRAAENIHRSTCQFFLNKNGEPKARGTGVCLLIFNRYFVLTAAHVAEDYEGPLYIKCANGLLAFDHNIISNKVNLRDDDRIDFAILELPEKTVKQLAGYYQFIESNQLGINHTLELTPHYVAYGYPASQTRIIRGTNSIEDQASFIAVAPCATTDYSRFGCNPSNNIIVKYPQKRMVSMDTEKRGTGPSPHGMSGGGLWFVPETVDGNSKLELLVGILIEWPIKDRTKLIATRVDVFTEVFRLVYGIQLTPSIITTHIIKES
jgi:hypothetical protein